MKKVIITGASGFVGKNLTSYLNTKGYSITQVSLKADNWRDKFESKHDAVIHLAGKAHDTSNVSRPEEYFAVNSELTKEVFEMFLKMDCQDFFYFSSVKAVVDSFSGILDEDVISNPLTPYGQSKHDAESYLLNQKLPMEKKVFIVRPCMIHGEGNKGNLNLLYAIVKRGLPWPLASFLNTRSFLSIDNLNFLVEKMIGSNKVPSGIYHFADDEPVSTNELVALIAATTGRKYTFLKIPTRFVKAFVRLGDFLPLPINSERLKKLTESYVVSNSKIKTVLGIEKLPVNSKEGLQKTFQSFNR